MIACNHLDDQSISKLLMKSTSKNIASCDYKIPFCDYKIPFCDYKAIFAFDLINKQMHKQIKQMSKKDKQTVALSVGPPFVLAWHRG